MQKMWIICAQLVHNFIDFDNILAASQQQQEEGALLLLQAQAKADIGCQEEKQVLALVEFSFWFGNPMHCQVLISLTILLFAWWGEIRNSE